jgi:hypothetical protein
VAHEESPTARGFAGINQINSAKGLFPPIAIGSRQPVNTKGPDYREVVGD